MEETVFLFGSRKQYRSWMKENCGNCRCEPTGFPGCHLAAAVTDAMFTDGLVPLHLAERIGYFDMVATDRVVLPHTWMCREFKMKSAPRREL